MKLKITLKLYYPANIHSENFILEHVNGFRCSESSHWRSITFFRYLLKEKKKKEKKL